MKSEPEVYSMEDLRKSKGPAMWEGCRNYTVRNFIRDKMADGDLAFFYYSNSNPSGIAGVMQIIGDAFPDPTQFDPKSEYFDPKAPTDGSRWLARNVTFIRKFKRLISLAELREVAGLEEMMVTKRGQRLSIMPVTETEWKIVCELKGI